MLLDADGFPISGDDEWLRSWNDGNVEIIRQPGTELRDGEFRPLNQFGLFWIAGPPNEQGSKLVCGGTFDYVSNYFWREFA